MGIQRMVSPTDQSGMLRGVLSLEVEADCRQPLK